MALASGESKLECGYTPYVNRTDQNGQCKKAARGNYWAYKRVYLCHSTISRGATNVCLNQKEVGSNHEGKTAHFVLEVKGSNGGQMCTL